MKVTVIGIGLIGGSIALDLKQRKFAKYVCGIEKNPVHAKKAKALKLVDEITNLSVAITKSNIIILATPVDECLKLLPTILDKIKEDQVVCDVTSTKELLCKKVKNHPMLHNYVPSHPMAGTEFTGPEAAHTGLFDLKYVIICNKKHISSYALSLVKKMYQTLCMKIVYMDAGLHDFQVAYVSHLSHISAFALSLTVMDKEKKDKHIFELAGGGFNSTVRLAKSAASMWTPIFLQNKSNVLDAIENYTNTLKYIQAVIKDEDTMSLSNIIQKANGIKSIIDKSDIVEAKKKKIKIMTHDINIKDFTFWLKFLKKQKPICIAGPCSAETEAQVLETAKQLKNTAQLSIFRAGIWKPRTRPNTFEGVGEKGLKWLQRVKNELGMFVTTEVANGEHVEKALKHNIDILWIGARSTANPFVVQNIADALKGTNIPIMIKNPINPDTALWLGAIERIHAAGISTIAAVHRGFSSFVAKKFRNPPQWQIPIELKNYIPTIPMICDPSHISGNKKCLDEISQHAMDLNFDGLMIEAHHNPEVALSDAKQQVTPKELKNILDKIYIRKTVGANKKLNDTLSAMRNLIDELDDDLLEVMEKRMKVSETIGMFKKQNNLIVLQQKRWEELMRRNLSNGKNKGLSKAFINSFFKTIHQESINKQSKIINN